MNLINKHTLAALALVACAGLAQAQSAPASAAAPSAAKRELIGKLLAIQITAADPMAKNMVMQQLLPISQEVRIAMGQVPPDRREATEKAIQADVNKFGEEMTRLIKDRIVKVAPETISPLLDSRFSEDELRQIVAWMESPVAKKFDSASPELSRALLGKVVSEVGSTFDARLRTLEGSIVKHLALPKPPAAGSSPAGKPAAKK